MSAGEELVVLSANCQGLQNKNKRRDVIDYLSNTKVGIIYVYKIPIGHEKMKTL